MIEDISRLKENRDAASDILYKQIVEARRGEGTYGGRWYRNRDDYLTYHVMDPDLHFAHSVQAMEGMRTRLLNRNDTFARLIDQKFYGIRSEGGILKICFGPDIVHGTYNR